MLSRQRAIELWKSNDLIELGIEADAVRQQLHTEQMVTYTLGSDQRSVVEYLFQTAETIEQRLDTLGDLYLRQEDIGDILLFRPRVEITATGMEYLKTVAISRLFLANVPHIQASCKQFGLKVAQIALRFGADDLGVAEENVSEEELRRVIRDAGFSPKQRDALFRTYSIA